LFWECLCLLGSKKRKEHVESNLDGVDVGNAPLVGDEPEVDEVDDRPHLTRSLARSEKVVLNLVSDHSERVSVHKAR